VILKRKIFWVFPILLVLGIGASIYTYQWAHDYVANQLPDTVIKFLQEPNAPAPAPAQTAAVAVAGTPSANMPKVWNGKERVNVLVMGIDQREGEVDPAYRTDTMIVLTLDPVTLRAGMLSIPRDLWVPIPGYDNGRINTANFLGDAYDYPGGGPALARKTVQQLLGVPIHYYARVNFTAFEDLVDRIGGITVNVPEDIYDPEYPTENYGTEVFSINKGVQQLDGATALKFARTRHSLANGDFDRARNQQLVIMAVKEKLSDPQVLLSLVGSAPEIVKQLSGSVKTDLTLDQVQQLAALVQKIDRGNIQSAVLDQTYTEFATTLTNPPQQVQVPIRSKIAELRDTFFSVAPNAAVAESASSGAAAGATSPATPATPWQGEKARVALLNGTLTAGLSQKVSELLKSQGFNVVRVGNTPDERFDYQQTEISDYSGKTLTLNALIDALDVKSTAKVKRYLDPGAAEDIVVILGNDIKLP
jgi:polyisoprenyl-teichoic acid--peptidoglycan teichoic acid transferase